MSSGRIERALGIDFGTKRLGFAISDEMGWVAEPLEVWKRSTLEEDLSHIRELIAGHGVGRVVVGIPFRLDGSKGPSAERAQLFIDKLTDAFPELPIKTQDEALTTWEAEQRLKERNVPPGERKDRIDAYAAMVILQEDLDSRRPPGEPLEIPVPRKTRRKR